MILLFHIVVALTSLAYSGYLFFKPSKSGLNIAYALVAATLASGTYLVVGSGHLVSACVSGLVYLAFVLPAIVAARNKLASIVNEEKDLP